MIVEFVAVTSVRFEAETSTPFKFTLLSVVGLEEVELMIVELPVIPSPEAIDAVA
jgi:hypothetical protein